MMKKSLVLITVLSLLFIAGCRKQASDSVPSVGSSTSQRGAAADTLEESSKPNEAQLRSKDDAYVQAALEKKDPKLCDKLYDAADQTRCKELVKQALVSSKAPPAEY